MSSTYNHQEIEQKWQKYWVDHKIFAAEDKSRKPKYYCLIEFPYPSAEGLHVGHPRSYTALDIIARKRKMEGYNVLYPIGFDAFGLPAENYAIKTGVHPKIKTEENINNFRKQLKSLGLAFDWSREVITSDPEYYKWTQWIFLQLFKHGLAYKAEMPINFCLDCQVGLANEEVVGGQCERCGSEVIKKTKKQWLLKITKYADRLEKDLAGLDYIERVKIQQKNWIGKSEGAMVRFKISSPYQGEVSCLPAQAGSDGGVAESIGQPPLTPPWKGGEIKVYTTRPDTLFGATYMVLAPEHELVQQLKDQITNFSEVKDYIKTSAKKSDLERTELNKEKTGVELYGIKAINPVNNQEIPIWLSDYVLASYGTGAIMAVPAHDERDYEFAKKFNLEIIEVIKGGDVSQAAYTDINDGQMVNSDFLNGLNPKEAIVKMTGWLKENNLGEPAVNYKLRDWVFSRQRYWGEPIPLIFCSACKKSMENSKFQIPNSKYNEGELLNPGWVADENLPLELPEIKEFQASGEGESPLAKLENWVNVKCPKCGGSAKRETDTMPQWAGSSWYFLRYADPHNNKALASEKNLKYWTPVDWYNGGMEHTTLHLLYSRFWHKFLYDIGVVPTSEPYQKRTSHGFILGEGGEKMSKSRGNVINPDDVVKEYGADTFRLYEMFMGPFDQAIPWDTKGVVGMRRFLEKIWIRFNGIIEDDIVGGVFAKEPLSDDKNIKELEILLNQTIKKVSDDIENMKFNTAVSALMILLNKYFDLSISDFAKEKIIFEKFSKNFLILFSPFAPHIAEELWQKLGHNKILLKEEWPKADEAKLKDEEVEIVVQINGKVRAKIKLPSDISEEEAIVAAKADLNIQKYLADQKIKKTVFVPGRLISFVI
ncbi:MAG: leucine--tRNA ligase [Candidatus Buchananbacteria bacterium RIFCSPHIGHO2_02_FULL_40_13]|nr:MAG: leucine--tRNA ligase [Candidatus Buchananbacteria bacterium RIFCSPHIGHO2_02_FULL_40_13]